MVCSGNTSCTHCLFARAPQDGESFGRNARAGLSSNCWDSWARLSVPLVDPLTQPPFSHMASTAHLGNKVVIAAARCVLKVGLTGFVGIQLQRQTGLPRHDTVPSVEFIFDKRPRVIHRTRCHSRLPSYRAFPACRPRPLVPRISYMGVLEG